MDHNEIQPEPSTSGRSQKNNNILSTIDNLTERTKKKIREYDNRLHLKLVKKNDEMKKLKEDISSLIDRA